MCTLIAIHRCVPGASLIVAANRDEYLDRAAEGPALRTTPAGPVIAPLDLRAGGTWLGFNAQGVFAAITNRSCAEPDSALRSRGHVVMDALAAPSARGAADALKSLPAGAHNPFNLFIADEEAAFALVYEGAPEIAELAPGVHVVGNVDPDDRSHFKVGRMLERAERAAGLEPDAALAELAETCREHEAGGPRGPLDDTCVHAGGYGTRSSMLLWLGEDGECRLQYADGPPCRTEYEDFTSLLTELTHWEGYGAEGASARSVS